MGDFFRSKQEIMLVMAVKRVQFTRLPIKRLETLLDSANFRSHDALVTKPTQSHFTDTTPHTSSQKQGDSDRDENDLRSGNASLDDDSETPQDDCAVNAMGNFSECIEVSHCIVPWIGRRCDFQ